MLKVLSAALLLAVPPCAQQSMPSKRLQADVPLDREIDRYTQLMSDYCDGVCVLLPTYPPVIAGRLRERRAFNPAPIPVPPSPEGWAYEQQRLNR